KSPGLLYTNLSLIEALYVVAHHLADDSAEMPAGKGVVADVSDAFGREIAFTDVQNFLLDIGRHPRINAMARNVIELSQTFLRIDNASLSKVHVIWSQRIEARLPSGNLARRQVYAHEPAVWQSLRHRNNVAPGGAAQFQKTTTIHRRR